MPNYTVVYDNGKLIVKRDRNFYLVPPVAVTKEEFGYIVKISARKKQEAINKAVKLIQTTQQREAEDKKKVEEEMGSTISQTSLAKTEQKSPIELVPESFEKEA